MHSKDKHRTKLTNTFSQSYKGNTSVILKPPKLRWYWGNFTILSRANSFFFCLTSSVNESMLLIPFKVRKFMVELDKKNVQHLCALVCYWSSPLLGRVCVRKYSRPSYEVTPSYHLPELPLVRNPEVPTPGNQFCVFFLLSTPYCLWPACQGANSTKLSEQSMTFWPPDLGLTSSLPGIPLLPFSICSISTYS